MVTSQDLTWAAGIFEGEPGAGRGEVSEPGRGADAGSAHSCESRHEVPRLRLVQQITCGYCGRVRENRYILESEAIALRDAARAEQREADAKLVEVMWQPSVGGYPSGSELAAAIRNQR